MPHKQFCIIADYGLLQLESDICFVPHAVVLLCERICFVQSRTEMGLDRDLSVPQEKDYRTGLVPADIHDSDIKDFPIWFCRNAFPGLKRRLLVYICPVRVFCDLYHYTTGVETD